jgi:hypothetical protein
VSWVAVGETALEDSPPIDVRKQTTKALPAG